jgi:hypothetical protein
VNEEVAVEVRVAVDVRVAVRLGVEVAVKVGVDDGMGMIWMASKTALVSVLAVPVN